MATNIPAPFKTADVHRFAVRAAQVEKAKPAAAYWCYYYILDKLLAQGLHKTDDECQAYVISLMDKVEQMKKDHTEDDAMRDDLAGKAYIEQFGLETFLRADNAIRANKATKQTADTFQAAYTFLDVMNVWPPVDPDITSKIKFAKYHAVRIAKAIKAGEDPNLSNPSPELEPTQAPALDADDPEVRAITGLGAPSPAALDTGSTSGWPPGIAPQFVDRPPVSPPDGPISLPPYPNEHSSQSTQAMPHQPPAVGAEGYYQNSSTASHADVSPLPASDNGAGSGEYFPALPAAPSAFSPQNPLDMSSPTHQDAIDPRPSTYGGASAEPSHASTQPQPPVQLRGPPPPSAAPMTTPAHVSTSNLGEKVGEVDDAKMTSAQKHAKFAISALNFEDVGTAIKELRAALADLGAS